MDAAFCSPLSVRPFVVGPASAIGGTCTRPSLARHAIAARPAVANITMKRNRFHAPRRPQRPGAEEVKLPEDGTPIFAIFVRSTTAKIWYPLGSVKGDDRSKQLVSALKNGLGRALYANALDKGIAQTVYGQGRQRFTSTAIRMYPQLKRSQKTLEFGYKVAAVGLEDQKIKMVTEDMSLPFFAWARKEIKKALDGQKEVGEALGGKK